MDHHDSERIEPPARRRRVVVGDPAAVGEDDTLLEQRIDTEVETWLFDRLRRRFRRLPLGRDPHDPSIVVEWQSYYALRSEPDGAFTVLLDAAGTRRHRVTRAA